MWNLKSDTNKLTYKKKTDLHTQRTDLWLPRGKVAGISRCKLLCVEWISVKVLLYYTGNYIQYLVMIYNRKESEYIYIYIGLCVQLLSILCDSLDYSPPGSSVLGNFQARILEWVAISFSRGSSWCRDQTCVSCISGRFFTRWVIGEIYIYVGFEIQPVNPKGNQSWIFIGRTDAKTETPILWPPDAKNQLIGKDPDAGKDWRQEEKGTTEDEMVRWHHRRNRNEFE